MSSAKDITTPMLSALSDKACRGKAADWAKDGYGLASAEEVVDSGHEKMVCDDNLLRPIASYQATKDPV